MRRLLFPCAVLCMAVGFLLADRSPAQEGEALAIINKAIKAHFPKGLDKKNQGVITKTKGTLHISGLDLPYMNEVSVHPPKFKEVMTLTVQDKTISVTTVFNGTKGWIRADDKEVPLTDAILDELKEAAYTMEMMQG